MGQKAFFDKERARALNKNQKGIALLVLHLYTVAMNFPLRWLLVFVILFQFRAEVIGADQPRNFAMWEPEISAFERSDATNPPPLHAILFTGSSTIRFWTNLAKDYPDKQVINRGFGGSEICDATHFADRIVFPYQPRQIVFRAGGNDLWDGKTPEEVFDDYKAFVTLVEKRLPDTTITFISWSPTIARWKQHDKEKQLNDLVKEFSARDPHLEYIETADMILGVDGKPRADLLRADHLHMNAAGYKLLAERVRPYLK
jgi:lysophospholipase L1-like esterase